MKYASPKKYFSKFEKEFAEALQNVINSDYLILGKELELFENSFASIHQVKHCVGVNSCTDALTMCLLAAGIQPGDEVITTAITAPATVISILNTGAKPVIVDVASPTFCIGPTAIEAAINKKTKAVVPVHLHGFSADMERISFLCKKHQLILIEDCAQASGAKFKGKYVGNFGEAAAFSFYPTKNIGCLGDGGAVLTNNKDIFQKIRNMRFYGFEKHGKIIEPGFNSRMDELQAAFLNVMLPHFKSRNKKRIYYAHKYHEHLNKYKNILPPLMEGAVYHQFPIRVIEREKFIKQLSQSGISVGVHYPFTMKDHPAFRQYCREIPVAEKVVNEFVSIPIQPEILDDHFNEIIKILQKCLQVL